MNVFKKEYQGIFSDSRQRDTYDNSGFLNSFATHCSSGGIESGLKLEFAHHKKASAALKSPARQPIDSTSQTLSSILSNFVPEESLETKLQKLEKLIRGDNFKQNNLNLLFLTKEIKRTASPVRTLINKPAVNLSSSQLNFQKQQYLQTSPTRKKSLIKGGTLDKLSMIRQNYLS